MTEVHEPPLDLADYRRGARTNAEQRREARRDFERYSRQEADAERDYRMRLAVVFAQRKSEGESDKRAEMAAKAEAADLAHRRDIAHSLAFSSRLRIEELERDAASLRHISERSGRIDPAGGGEAA